MTVYQSKLLVRLCLNQKQSSNQSVTHSKNQTKKQNNHIPLHPDKTSMPITCQDKNTTNQLQHSTIQTNQAMQNTTPPFFNDIEVSSASSKPQKFPNFVLHLFAAKCPTFLKKLTKSSLINIQREYFNNQTTMELEELKTMVDKAPYFTVLALFFLLLNVDGNLKDKVWDLELNTNYPKLERFLLDLKHPIISEFCVNDAISTPIFIDQIWETYVIA